VLLQILDDGRLTDGQGKTIDFKNTLIIMTSNVGSHLIQEMTESNRKEMEEKVFQALRTGFKPEFLNRIDETIIFHNLTHAQIRQIVDIQLERLIRRLTAMNIELQLSDDAKDLLSEKGFDPVYGARPLKRTIQQYIENPLSMEILKGGMKESSQIKAYAEGDKVQFNIIPMISKDSSHAA